MNRILCLLLTSCLFASAAAAESYTVAEGDTLSKLSLRYEVTEDQIKQLNKLGSDELLVGQMLVIPNRNDASSQPTKRVKVIVRHLNLRQAPTLHSNILAVLPMGT
jgi:LysM repeat protein